MTGLHRTTRWRMERRGEFPRRRKVTTALHGWLESEILEWMRTRPFGLTGGSLSGDGPST